MLRYPSLVERVLIFEWDVHHGQGTQEIFWNDSNVLVVDMNLGRFLSRLCVIRPDGAFAGVGSQTMS